MLGKANIDIQENYNKCLDAELLNILLKDRSSNKNIIWATDIYANKGTPYDSWEQITINLITGRLGKTIRPRIDKSEKEQKLRIKDKAEVFTPSWICNEMNNYLCDEWFDAKNVFNIPNDKTWKIKKKKIIFKNEKDKTWQDFVKLKILEISCGEAPFLVSRYDTTTGELIEINNRIGALDRKLRVVNENCDNEQDWFQWTLIAFKSTYGYEWQGDNLLIARENLLFTFIDYYITKFNKFPNKEYLIEIATILSWNLWQMDGLKYVIPNSCNQKRKRQLSLFENDELTQCEGCLKNDNNKHIGIYSKIMNWETQKIIKFFKGGKYMKFDFVIGNPPYQENDGGGTGDSAKPVYQLFINEAKKISNDSFSFIVPSRWMKGGKGLNDFRHEMINDTHIKCITDYENAFECFPGVHIDGGVCYFIWNKSYKGMVDYKYKPNNEDFIYSKRYLKTNYSNTVIRDYRQSTIIMKSSTSNRFSNIVSYRNPYGLSADLFNNIDKYNDLNICRIKKRNYIKIYGVEGKKGGAKRVVGFIDKNKIVKNNENIKKYKLFFSKAYMTTSTIPPEIILGNPLSACTETFLEIGPFNSSLENNNCLNYIKSKYFRALLFYNRHSLNISKESFLLIPLQDFTNDSDIDWTKSIHEIDLQLYKKYGLNQEEIEFIESHVKEMK